MTTKTWMRELNAAADLVRDEIANDGGGPVAIIVRGREEPLGQAQARAKAATGNGVTVYLIGRRERVTDPTTNRSNDA
jgi:hypothetical protein